MRKGALNSMNLQPNLCHVIKVKLEMMEELKELSARERECLYLICTGHAMREIAAMLFLSPRTIETHVGNIKSKLRVESKQDLIKMIFEQY